MPETNQQSIFEKLYTVNELSKLWNFSPRVISRLFEHEPDVVVLYNPHPDRRRYRSLRIPESVAIRLYRKMSLSRPWFEVIIR